MSFNIYDWMNELILKLLARVWRPSVYRAVLKGWGDRNKAILTLGSC